MIQFRKTQVRTLAEQLILQDLQSVKLTFYVKVSLRINLKFCRGLHLIAVRERIKRGILNSDIIEIITSIFIQFFLLRN